MTPTLFIIAISTIAAVTRFDTVAGNSVAAIQASTSSDARTDRGHRVPGRNRYPARWWTHEEPGARAAWRYCEILMQIRAGLKSER